MNLEKLQMVENQISAIKSEIEPNLAYLISSQLEIIKFIQSPTLMTTIFDNILLNLHNILKNESIESEQEWIKQQSSLIIQNFIFVMHYSLLVRIKEKKKEGDLLLKDLGCQIGESINKTLKKSANINNLINDAASSGGNLPAMLALNFSTSITEALTDGGHNSTLNKAISYFIENKSFEKEKFLFFNMVHQTIQKLERNYLLFGKQIIIYEMLFNYANHIELYSKETALKKKEKGFLGSIFQFLVKGIFLIIFSISLIIYTIYAAYTDSLMNEFLYILIGVGLIIAYQFLAKMIENNKIKKVPNQIKKVAKLFNPHI
jgi:GTP cyclohydrolase II